MYILLSDVLGDRVERLYIKNPQRILNPTNPGSDPGVHICRDTLLTPQLGEQVAIAHLAPRRRAEPQCHVSTKSTFLLQKRYGITLHVVLGFKAKTPYHPIGNITEVRQNRL